MAIALWIVQCLLGLIFIITGSFKFFQNREKIIASGGTWAEDFNPVIIKIIAGLELLSGITLIISKLSGQGHNLSLSGAAFIALIMAGAILVHLRRKEFLHAIINTVFLLMALFVVYAIWAA